MSQPDPFQNFNCVFTFFKNFNCQLRLISIAPGRLSLVQISALRKNAMCATVTAATPGGSEAAHHFTV
jgi:hypothetical protein